MRTRVLRRSAAAAAVCAVAAAALTAAALAGDTGAGFTTSQGSMLRAVAPGSTTKPIITVGETLPGGYRFEAIPDGISVDPRGKGRVDLFVNHETSTVPFPYITTSPKTLYSQNDFDNAQVSLLSLSQHSMGVLHGRYVIGSHENYQRFCSNYLATEKEGFDRPLLFTNEEAIDWVNRSGRAWPATIGAPEARQAGVVVAHDVRTGQTRPIWGMGRHNHENSVALPGFGKPVLLSGDDTFVSNPAQSQLYAYIADDSHAVWNDEGDLYAFVADPPAVNDYYDFGVGSTASISGRFVRVPDFADDPAKSIAHGRRADGTDVMAADFGYPAPPNDGTWQRDPSNVGIDGPQWVLEHWGDLNNVFQFVRIEDVAYDKRPNPDGDVVVYLADSGRGSTSTSGNAFASTNGRVWRMVVDGDDPTVVKSLSILVEGDNDVLKKTTEIHQPDNLETTANGSLLVQEDPGSGQQFAVGDPAAIPARVWQVHLGTANPLVADSAAKRVVAEVDQSADEGPTDVDPPDQPPIPAPAFPLSPGNIGSWESSGIVDVSHVFGDGAFLATVQAHTLWVEQAPGDLDTAAHVASPDFTYKREGGQLVLLRVPGA